MRSAVLILALLAIAPSIDAAVKSKVRHTYYSVMSGSGKLLESSPDRETCVRRAEEIGAAAGETATSGGNVTSCRTVDNFIWTYGPGTAPPPTCPPLSGSPRAQACPAGTTGTWTQTGTVGPPPSCAVTWSPAAPTAAECPPVPAALKPPTSVAAAPVPGALAIRVSWVAAADAQATLIEFCRGSTCTNFASPVCRTSGPYDHALPAGATARYRLRSSRSPTCSADLSPAAGIVNATVPVITVPRTGTALISWTPVPRNTDGSALTNLAGYRIVYGTTAEALTRVTQVSSQLTSYTVESLPSGETWYFALKAYNSDGVESDLSRVVSKVIP